MQTDNVNHPSHYTDNKFLGHECIDFAELLGFNLGNAFKYIFRAEHKGHALEDIDKAMWYVERFLKKPPAFGYVKIIGLLSESVNLTSPRDVALFVLLKSAVYSEFELIPKAIMNYRKYIEMMEASDD